MAMTLRFTFSPDKIMGYPQPILVQVSVLLDSSPCGGAFMGLENLAP